MPTSGMRKHGVVCKQPVDLCASPVKLLGSGIESAKKKVTMDTEATPDVPPHLYFLLQTIGQGFFFIIFTILF